MADTEFQTVEECEAFMNRIERDALIVESQRERAEELREINDENLACSDFRSE